MEALKLVRIDFRLIHGQVVTKWLKHSGADKIIVVDDMLSKDEFMSSIYVMAAPPGIEVLVVSVSKVVEMYQEGVFNEGKYLMLFKDVATTYRACKDGLPLTKVQIGGLGSGPGKKKIYGPIAMDEKEFEALNELDSDGIEIYLHQVPDENPMSFDKVKQKFI